MAKKVVLITGAAKGIGAAIAKEFAKENYDIIIHYFNSKLKAEELKKYLEKEYSIKVLLIKGDFSNNLELNMIIKDIKDNYSKIDVLVNNASLSIDCDVIEKTKEQFMKVLEVNLVTPFLLIKELSNLLYEGTVINISSTDAINTGSDLNIDYSASKAGLNSLTKTMSLAYPNIRICAVAPNWVRTETIMEMDKDYLESELKRIGQKELIEPEEVAKQVIRIVEDKEILSGSIITIDRKEER